jgi:predicted nucleotidyltransferase
MNISELRKQIISTFLPFEPEKIILFGSIIREDWDFESDVDVIVVYNTDKSFIVRLEELYMSWNIPKAVDILAYTPYEFEKMVKESFFIQDAIREGKVIYERG